MGTGGKIVGTPPFVAPEVVYRLATDARTDLFSLGATLYYALTGRPAYPARDFSDLAQSWTVKPVVPSQFCADVPPALDALVMSLLSLEPALRPRSAFEVMQRLAALAGIERVESEAVSQAYLATPVMLGRSEGVSAVRSRISAALAGSGGGVWIGGSAGMGRSRMLDACVLEAKTLGATVLRASASATQGEGFAVAHALAEQLLEVLPNEAIASALAAPDVLSALFEPLDAAVPGAPAARPRLRSVLRAGTEPAAVSAALSNWIAEVARACTLVIAVDDVHQIDEPSVALLVTLAHQAQQQRLLLLLTAESTADGNSAVLNVLAGQCMPLELQPLSAAQTDELFKSLFGDVPNVGLVSARIHDVARGNPRECMDLAQHLCDNGLILYEAGSWALPSRLDAAELPSSAEQAFRERVAALPEFARWIAEAQAMASHDAFTREEYARLCAGRDPQRIEEALVTLTAHQVLVSDGRVYALSRGNRAATLTASLDAAELRERHRALAELYETQGDHRAVALIHHLLEAGLLERAVDRLLAYLESIDSTDHLATIPVMDPERIASIYLRALAAAQQLGRPARQIHELRQILTAISIIADDSVYWHVAPAWREQLERDSGLTGYRELVHVEDRNERLKLALERAMAAYVATPEAERVYRPDEAIKLLVHYVVISIALGARTLDARLIASLPELLEPFTPLSPLIDAMWDNAICTYEVNCAARQERARLRAKAIYARLEHITDTELRYVRPIRCALAYCIGAIESMLGLLSAMSWAEVLDRDPLQRVNAMQLRRVVRLQQGDAEGAERYRTQAELLAAQAVTRQMFTNTLTSELNAQALAHDLTGVKQTADAIEPLAERCPGWVPFRHLARGHFQRLRGNLPAALAEYEQCIALNADDPAEPWRSIATWPRAAGCAIEVLVELGRAQEARALGERALVRCHERGLEVSIHDIARPLALAEASLGAYAAASGRLDRVIAEQRELGITGLVLGASYEARARIAIWANDGAAVEEYAALTAREYRHGRGSPLGALYERLMDEARRGGVRVLPQLSEFESTMMLATKVGHRVGSRTSLTQTMRDARNADERAACALEIICEARGASGGYLYLIAGERLVLAASDAPAPPAEGLLEFVSRRVAEELEAEVATALVTETLAPTASATAMFIDPGGVPHLPVLLTCVVDGQALCAGVAVLIVAGPQKPQPGAAETVASVAALLMDACDELKRGRDLTC
jgi:hypothetical protein